MQISHDSRTDAKQVCVLMQISHDWRIYAEWTLHYIDDLVQDCSISCAKALEIQQYCAKPSIWALYPVLHVQCYLFMNLLVLFTRYIILIGLSCFMLISHTQQKYFRENFLLRGWNLFRKRFNSFSFGESFWNKWNRYCFRKWLVTQSVPSHYLMHCLFVDIIKINV